jgi:hypothetical protein
MASHPIGNGLTAPNTSNRELSLWRWEVRVRLDDLVDPLPRDAQHLSDFGDAHQVLEHIRIYIKA